MILVTGTSGFVGGKIMNLCKDVIPCPSLKGLGEDEVRRIVLGSGADTIIHTAAISDIGECAKNPVASYIANVQIPIYLAKASKTLVSLLGTTPTAINEGVYEFKSGSHCVLLVGSAKIRIPTGTYPEIKTTVPCKYDQTIQIAGKRWGVYTNDELSVIAPL